MNNIPYNHIQKGWECPKCKRVNSPHMPSCNCVPVEKEVFGKIGWDFRDSPKESQQEYFGTNGGG